MQPKMICFLTLFFQKCDGVNLWLASLLVAAAFLMSVYLHVSVMGSSSKLKIVFYFVQIASLMIPSTARTTALALLNFRALSGSA